MLLDQLESDPGDAKALQFSKNYNAFELPGNRALHEIAIYWYLFNNFVRKSLPFTAEMNSADQEVILFLL